MRLIFIDESGTSSNETHALVLAVIVHGDAQYFRVCGAIKAAFDEFVPPEILQGKFVYHTTDLLSQRYDVAGLAIKRANSKDWCLVDCGEGTQHRVLQTSLSLQRLRAIFITHVHGDHCYGLPGLLASAALAGRTDALRVVGPKGIARLIEVIRDVSQLHLPYELEFSDVATSGEGIETESFSVYPAPLSHRVPSFGYVFQEHAEAPRLEARLRRLSIILGVLPARRTRPHV
jgi:ribonuclease BN (tRNA processing enzyme)